MRIKSRVPGSQRVASGSRIRNPNRTAEEGLSSLRRQCCDGSILPGQPESACFQDARAGLDCSNRKYKYFRCMTFYLVPLMVYVTVAHTGTAPHHPSRQASCPAPAEPKPDQPQCTFLLMRISASPVKNRSPVTSPSSVSVPIQSLHFPQYAKKSVACHLTTPDLNIRFD